ncbi:MAG: glycosyltransferase, partial [Longimicrobiales bacterium]
MIYICIPSYNEQQTIGVLLWKIRQVMGDFRRDYHVLVLDDGSTDDTDGVLEPYLRVMPLTVLRHVSRQGYARSIERLLREAAARAPYPKRDCVVTLQADFTDDPADIVDLVKRIEGGADLVNTAPARHSGPAPRTQLALRHLARRAHRWPAEITDPLATLRAYRVISLRKMLDVTAAQGLLHGSGATVGAQLLRLALPHARRLEEVEVTRRSASRRRPTRTSTWLAARELLGLTRLRTASPEPVAEVEELTGESVVARPGRGGAERGNGRRGGPRSARHAERNDERK